MVSQDDHFYIFASSSEPIADIIMTFIRYLNIAITLISYIACVVVLHKTPKIQTSKKS